MITVPYLLVLNVPLHWHGDRYWADPLWKKDLEAHLNQISNLSIVCPVTNHAPPADWQALSTAKPAMQAPRSASGITVHALPAMAKSSVLLLPYLAMRLWRAITRARIVHVGIAGWPFPLGWPAIAIARLRGRTLVLVVESAFWRVPPGTQASWLARARATFWERLNTWSVAACDVCFFTTSAYRDELYVTGRGAAHILPAIWIDDEQLIEQAQLAELEAARCGRFLFAGRFTRSKGVELLLDAVRQSGVAVDFVGTGDLHDAVLAAQRSHPHLVRLIDPVDYGVAFTALVDGYAALVVPTLSDEQPRVIFDAFARGVCVIASATSGNRQIAEHGHNALLFAPGDVNALVAALVEAKRDGPRIAAMGLAARRAMDGWTHAAMHAERADKIGRTLKPSVENSKAAG